MSVFQEKCSIVKHGLLTSQKLAGMSEVLSLLAWCVRLNPLFMERELHQWHYIKTGLLDEHQIGPIAEQELKQLAFDGKIGLKTKVHSPTRTKGNWTVADSIPALKGIVEKGKAARLAAKQEQAAVKQQQAADRSAENDIANSQRAAEDPKSVRKIKDHVSKFLTASEQIEFVCIQSKAVAIKADAVVVTNKRLMIVRPKLMGRFDFDDMLWRELRNAHIQENVFGSTFSMEHATGKAVSIDYLSKVKARQLYQIAQQREEDAEETRRKRRMEETAAGATQIVTTGTVPAAQAPSDPMQRLMKLKTMLEAGLIDQADFDKRKSEILSEI